MWFRIEAIEYEEGGLGKTPSGGSNGGGAGEPLTCCDKVRSGFVSGKGEKVERERGERERAMIQITDGGIVAFKSVARRCTHFVVHRNVQYFP
jgi:hypothetical protein